MGIVTIFLAWLLSAGNDAKLQTAPGIPFAFVNHQIVLTISVSGHDSLNFLLDSGTDSSTIDAATARRIGLNLLATVPMPGVPPAVWLRDLEIGPLRADSIFAVAVDLTEVGKSLGRPLHGVLGHNVLADRIVRIDYPNHVVQFLSEAPPIEKTGGNVMLPMHFMPGRYIPLLENVYVNGKPIRATLDTGSSMSLLLFPRVIEELGLQREAAHAPKAKALIYGGNIEVRKGPAVQIRLQASVFDSVPVYFSMDDRTDSVSVQRDGNLGNEFLQNTRLTLDYRHHQIILER